MLTTQNDWRQVDSAVCVRIREVRLRVERYPLQGKRQPCWFMKCLQYGRPPGKQFPAGRWRT